MPGQASGSGILLQPVDALNETSPPADRPRASRGAPEDSYRGSARRAAVERPVLRHEGAWVHVDADDELLGTGIPALMGAGMAR